MYRYMDFLWLIVIIPLIWGMKYKAELKESFISKKDSCALKGGLSLVIVLHHLCLNTEGGVIFRGFSDMGYIGVAFFFFLSGYGSCKNYIRNSEYKKKYFVRRVFPVIITYLIIASVYWCRYAISGWVATPNIIISNMMKGFTFITYAWYIRVILLFYMIFYVLMSICKSSKGVIRGIFIFCAMWIGGCIGLNWARWWFFTVIFLFAGSLVALYEEQIMSICCKYYTICLIGAIILFGIINKLGVHHVEECNDFFSMLIIDLQCALFIWVIALVCMKIRIGNDLIYFLGGISLQIYLSHALWMDVLRSGYVYIKNEALWCLSVIICTVIFAYIMHIASKKIIRINNMERAK